VLRWVYRQKLSGVSVLVVCECIGVMVEIVVLGSLFGSNGSSCGMELQSGFG